MRKSALAFLRPVTAILLPGIIFFACGKGGDSPPPAPNPCAGVTIAVSGTITDADVGQNNGSIAASATGGSSLTFSIDGGAFQSSGTFNNLTKGSHSITAKDGRGCTGSKSFTVGEKAVCNGVTITVNTTTTASDPCSGTGTITITAAGSTNFTYSLNGGAFQSSNIFSNVASGNHNVTAKDAGGCTGTASVSVAAGVAGPLFTAVKGVLSANCAIAGCHVNPAPTGGLNFADNCTIVLNKDRIRERAVISAGTPNQMPPPPNAALSQSDRDKITQWVVAGGRFTD
jgi:hypothetical protein